jgi:hypothetical protein
MPHAMRAAGTTGARLGPHRTIALVAAAVFAEPSVAVRHRRRWHRQVALPPSAQSGTVAGGGTDCGATGCDADCLSDAGDRRTPGGA